MPNEIYIHRATDDTAETSNFLVRNPNTNIKANRKQSELKQANRSAIQAVCLIWLKVDGIRYKESNVEWCEMS